MYLDKRAMDQVLDYSDALGSIYTLLTNGGTYLALLYLGWVSKCRIAPLYAIFLGFVRRPCTNLRWMLSVADRRRETQEQKQPFPCRRDHAL